MKKNEVEYRVMIQLPVSGGVIGVRNLATTGEVVDAAKNYRIDYNKVRKGEETPIFIEQKGYPARRLRK